VTLGKAKKEGRPGQLAIARGPAIRGSAVSAAASSRRGNAGCVPISTRTAACLTSRGETRIPVRHRPPHHAWGPAQPFGLLGAKRRRDCSVRPGQAPLRGLHTGRHHGGATARMPLSRSAPVRGDCTLTAPRRPLISRHRLPPMIFFKKIPWAGKGTRPKD